MISQGVQNFFDWVVLPLLGVAAVFAAIGGRVKTLILLLAGALLAVVFAHGGADFWLKPAKALINGLFQVFGIK